MNEKKWNTRLLAALLALVICCTAVIPVSALGRETGKTQMLGSAAVLPEAGEETDLFAGYVKKQLLPEKLAPLSSSYGETVLTGMDLGLYRALKPVIVDVAANGGQAVAEIPESVFSSVTATYPEGGDPKTAIRQALSEAMNFSRMMRSLLNDCPYELYWFDKTAGMSYRYSYSHNTASRTVKIVKMTVTMAVIPAYQAENYDSAAPAVTTDVSRVATAVATARQVVAANAMKSDMAKLEAYRDYIMGAVSYNQDAVGGAYGDPWQLIHVFDGDSSTNVVCEGYAKAFAYLCELSDFAGNVACYTVDGTMNGGAHMWNLVVTDIGNYMVDVTNTDTGTIGQNGGLFMAADPAVGDADGYTFQIRGSNIKFVYSDLTKSLYPAAMRTLGLHQTAKFDLSGANLRLGEDITMYFYINMIQLMDADYENYYVQIVRSFNDGVTPDDVVTVPYAQWEIYSSSMMRVAYPNIAACQMGETITVTVYNSQGTAVSNPWTDSVAAYCQRMIPRETTKELDKKVMVDLLNYGAAAQSFFKYDSAALVNTSLTPAQQALASSVPSLTDNSVKGTDYVGSSLVLRNKILLTVYFKNITTNMYAKVSYTDFYGQSQTLTVQGKEFVQNGSYYGVRLDDLVMAEYKNVVSVKIYNSADQLVASGSDSVESYLARKLNENALYPATAKALSSALAYANSKVS